MKKLLCVLLAVMMVMTLTACSKPLSEEIVGSWVTEIYLNGETAGLEGFEPEVGIPIMLTFSDDGEITIEAYEDAADETSEALNEAVEEYLTDMLYEQFTSQGYSKEEVDAMIQESTGMSMEEYVADAVAELDLYDEFVSALDSEGEYEVDDDKMTIEIDGDEAEVELDGDTLILDNAENEEDWEAAGFKFPVELKRVDD